jgi:protein-tyrosine-phosphatase
VSSAPAGTLRVLFVCTENAARSQIAEALLLRKGRGAFQVASAGSRPAARIHPLVVELLREQGIDWSHRLPKGFDEVGGQVWDMVITLCDRAREVCPAFPGEPIYAHWGMPDPCSVSSDGVARRRAFEETVQYLRQRIDFLCLVPFEKLQRAAREGRLAAINQATASDETPG